MKAVPDHAALIKKPSIWIAFGMSLAALAYGVVREADEGAAAHTWQILMAGQLPILPLFSG